MLNFDDLDSENIYFSIEKTHLPLHKLPVYIIYQILDHLEDKALFISIYDVCQYLNAVINSYDRFKVNINFIIYMSIKFP